MNPPRLEHLHSATAEMQLALQALNRLEAAGASDHELLQLLRDGHRICNALCEFIDTHGSAATSATSERMLRRLLLRGRRFREAVGARCSKECP